MQLGINPPEKIVTKDYRELEGAYKEIGEVAKKIEVLIEKGAIDKLVKVDLDYSVYTDQLSKLTYLSALSESLIYDLYQGLIQLDSSVRDFPQDFNQSHRDAYLRLKLRGVQYSK